VLSNAPHPTGFIFAPSSPTLRSNDNAIRASLTHSGAHWSGLFRRASVFFLRLVEFLWAIWP